MPHKFTLRSKGRKFTKWGDSFQLLISGGVLSTSWHITFYSMLVSTHHLMCLRGSVRISIKPVSVVSTTSTDLPSLCPHTVDFVLRSTRDNRNTLASYCSSVDLIIRSSSCLLDIWQGLQGKPNNKQWAPRVPTQYYLVCWKTVLLFCY